MTKVVIWISGSTKDLLDTYNMNIEDDYDELIRKLVFFEKLGIKSELVLLPVLEEDE